MGKVSELSQLIEELNRCGNTLIGISEDLKNLFSGSEEAKETVKEEKKEQAALRKDQQPIPVLKKNQQLRRFRTQGQQSILVR